MTHKEIAAKILDVIDLHKKSYVKTGISVDRVGKKYQEGIYTKTKTQCFQEIFGDDSFLYEPYRFMIEFSIKDIEYWTRSILKIT